MVRPGGVNPNDKTVMINPPGAYHNGGVNENLTPAYLSGKISLASPDISWEADTCNTHLNRNYLTTAIFSVDTFLKAAEGSVIPDSWDIRALSSHNIVA